jgi:hypothetical protein
VTALASNPSIPASTLVYSLRNFSLKDMAFLFAVTSHAFHIIVEGGHKEVGGKQYEVQCASGTHSPGIVGGSKQ